jgi:hypothetical protein
MGSSPPSHRPKPPKRPTRLTPKTGTRLRDTKLKPLPDKGTRVCNVVTPRSRLTVQSVPNTNALTSIPPHPNPTPPTPCPSPAHASAAANSPQLATAAQPAKPNTKPSSTPTEPTNEPTTKATTQPEPKPSETQPHTAGSAAKAHDPTTHGKPITSTQDNQTHHSHRLIARATFVDAS